MKVWKSALYLFGAIVVSLLVALALSQTFRDAATEAIDKRWRAHKEQERYDQQGIEGNQSVLRLEEIWLQNGVFDCAQFGTSNEPELCIEISGPASVEIGTPVNFRMLWRNLPENAQFHLVVVSAAAADQRWRYRGAVGGPLNLDVSLASSSGEAFFEWDGIYTDCMSGGEIPWRCENGEVGRYLMRASVYAPLDASEGVDRIIPGVNYAQPIPLVQAESVPFDLTGNPRMRGKDLNSEIENAIHVALPQETGQIIQHSQLRFGFFPGVDVDQLGEWKKGFFSYCARLDLDVPLQGYVDVCFPRRRRDEFGIALRPGDITASGQAHTIPGLLTAADARKTTRDYALSMTSGDTDFDHNPTDQELLDRLSEDPELFDGNSRMLRNRAGAAGLSYVDVSRNSLEFRNEAEPSWWLGSFDVQERVIEGPILNSWDNIFMRIEHDGTICMIEQTDKRIGDGVDSVMVFSDCLPGSQRRMER